MLEQFLMQHAVNKPTTINWGIMDEKTNTGPVQMPTSEHSDGSADCRDHW